MSVMSWRVLNCHGAYNDILLDLICLLVVV